MDGGVTDGHGPVTQVGSDEAPDIVVAGHLTRGKTPADGAIVGTHQTADLVRSRHLDRDHLQVPDDCGRRGLTEQSDVVSTTIDKQIGDGPRVPFEDGREAAG